MHVHVTNPGRVRTTIELTDAHRARLLALAAEVEEKGFSRLIQEAIEQYLAANEARRGRVEAALATLGSLAEEEANALMESVRVTRNARR